MATTQKIGKLIDQLYKLKTQIDEASAGVKKAEAVVKKIKEKYEAKEKEIFESFDKQDIDGAAGSLAKAAISKQTVANVTDWEKFYTFIHKTKSFDLLQRRVNNTAYKDRLEAGTKVPGTEKFIKVTLSLRKK